LKALHPSDPVVAIDGIPDQTVDSTATMNYQRQIDITCPRPGNGAWNATIIFMSDPATFGSIIVDDSTNVPVTGPLLNTSLGSTVHGASLAFATAFQHWRCMYAGLSAHLAAAAIADQGVVTAAQYPIRHSEMGCLVDGADEPSLRSFVRFNQTAVTPKYADLIRMPNAYSGRAKDGVYMPLKLESNHSRWHDEMDLRFDGSLWATNGNSLVISTAATGEDAMPYAGVMTAYLNESEQLAPWRAENHLLPCNDVVGGICFVGLSESATLSLTLRMGFEVRCHPGSPFSSFLKVSPAYDRMAIENYYLIARQLKDAYPVEYNDLGKLWDLIKGAARVISPVLSLVPGGAAIRGAGQVLGKIGDAAFSSSKKDVVSATDLEKAKRSVEKKLAEKSGGSQVSQRSRKARNKRKKKAKTT
jgi:hypothetical protein